MLTAYGKNWYKGPVNIYKYRVLSCGIQRREVRWKSTDQHEGDSKQSSALYLLLVFSLNLLFNPKDGGDIFVDKSVDFQRTTQRIFQKTELFIYNVIYTAWLFICSCQIC
jgi:hypothetical protein